MKIIDLLNKIANGETPDIKDGASHYHYSELENDYVTGMGYNHEHLFSNINILDYLNYKVEIIEDKKIEKLDKYAEVSGDIACEWSISEKKLKDKINELIDEVNKLKDESR